MKVGYCCVRNVLRGDHHKRYWVKLFYGQHSAFFGIGVSRLQAPGIRSSGGRRRGPSPNRTDSAPSSFRHFSPNVHFGAVEVEAFQAQTHFGGGSRCCSGGTGCSGRCRSRVFLCSLAGCGRSCSGPSQRLERCRGWLFGSFWNEGRRGRRI